MSDDRGHDTRELRLEGIGLFIVGALLLSGLAGAFYLGRWVERRSAPTTGFGAEVAGEMAPEGRGQLSDADLSGGHFDSVEGGEKEAEPQRQAVEPTEAAPPPTSTRTAQTTEQRKPASPPASASGGSWYVQVFAGLDRSSAETLVGTLGDAGFPVRLFTDSQGQSTVYKVRVGGYATRGEADAVKARLRDQGRKDAWVTQIR